jgi:hypothetical protein
VTFASRPELTRSEQPVSSTRDIVQTLAAALFAIVLAPFVATALDRIPIFAELGPKRHIPQVDADGRVR